MKVLSYLNKHWWGRVFLALAALFVALVAVFGGTIAGLGFGEGLKKLQSPGESLQIECDRWAGLQVLRITNRSSAKISMCDVAITRLALEDGVILESSKENSFGHPFMCDRGTFEGNLWDLAVDTTLWPKQFLQNHINERFSAKEINIAIQGQLDSHGITGWSFESKGIKCDGGRLFRQE